MKKILIIGHSHTQALEMAKTADDSFEFYRLKNTVNVKDSLSSLKPSNYDSIISVIRGNYHNIFGLVKLPEPFDFVLPESVDLKIQADARLLPVELVSKILFRGMDEFGYFQIASMLSRRFKGKTIYQLESPPPLIEAYVKKHPSDFKKQIEKLGVASPVFRYKLWRLHSRIVKDNFEKLGIKFVEIPKGIQNQNGLLSAKYCSKSWKEDPTHANSFYGDLVLNQIRSLHNIDLKEINYENNAI